MKLLSSWLTVIVTLGTYVAAVPQPVSHRVKERVVAPNDWVKLGRAPSDHVLELRIGLPQPDIHLLEKALYEVSDPYHERYGSHLSKEEVDELAAPHPESLSAVEEWLASHGILESDFTRSSAKDWVKIRIPVELAETMLDTTYHVWGHIHDGDAVVRTTSYSLPEHIHGHVDLIQPTTMFARFKGLKSTLIWSSDIQEEISYPGSSLITTPSGIQVDPSCNSTITISCLKQLYNATGYNSSATNGNMLGITGYLGQYANIMDLQSFYAAQRPDALNSTFKFVSVMGGLNSQNLSEAGDEADLDTQFAFGLTYPTPGTFYSTAGSPPYIPDADTPTDSNEPYVDWLDYILSQPSPPQTITTSYGDDEQTVPLSYAIRACNGFAQLGARGVSIMFSSGDGGVGDGDPDPTTQTCFTNDGRNVTRFIPGFPASCPYVTAVGGTVNIPETAVWFSGGGFSNYFPRPPYQESAVPAYLNALPNGTYAGLYNPYGRGIPDVSAQAWNFSIVYQQQTVKIGGTSASSPTFAGFVSLLNDARLSSGLPPLGFLNPLLYTKGLAGLNDVTSGNNPGCGTEGFNATIGWDPVTGLGTPDFGKLKAIVL
ncbi:hypothetical protein JAAARDRAFT_187770 [Jaapia argillacea MUCL 33604]|uniref:tripeptidyl-peptidase II n=1 Tax=Jaapia argillacea MUCL 33604 TaxID=933084 RepID=A0A067QE85_9AGAM|nr:hypothetical protein JAAARDRAFT_187770 [Jaapia argillacea MUCL 33604]